MRRTTFAIAFIAALAVCYGVLSGHQGEAPKKKGERRILYYVDPMHPSYRSNRPGVAPDCGMALQPVYADEKPASAQSVAMSSDASSDVRIDVPTQQLVGIRTVLVEKSDGTRHVRAVGRVSPEDTRVFSINAGVDGFIRDTYSDSVGTVITKDQRLATYYAPEFIAAASGFLAANERVPGSVTNEGARSIQNYSDRLRTLGMSDPQIQQLAKTKQLPESIDIVSPVPGVILSRNITKGQHFEHNVEFYRVADLGKVWVVAELDEQDAAAIHPGAEAQVSIRDEAERFTARVTNSLPQSETAGGTVKVRLEADNPGFLLRPEMVVDVDLSVHLPSGTSVPVDALVETGASARLYVARGDDTFEPRLVATGWRAGDRVQILKGVQPGERVVAQAAFLVDSESRLRTPGQ